MSTVADLPALCRRLPETVEQHWPMTPSLGLAYASTWMSELPVTPELWSLTETALDYGAHLAADARQTFQAALVTETADGSKGITQLVLLAEEGGKDPLRAALSGLAEQDDVLRAAVVVDGNTHINDVTEDAIIVLVGERGESHSHEFAQRYRRSGLRKKFQTVGNVGYVGERPAIFS